MKRGSVASSDPNKALGEARPKETMMQGRDRPDLRPSAHTGHRDHDHLDVATPAVSRGRNSVFVVVLAVLFALSLPGVAVAQENAPESPVAERLSACPVRAAPEGAVSSDAPDETNQERVITIDGSGGTQSGNLRFGPIVYEHPDPFGILATVSTLTICGHHAELTAPEGVSIFTGGQRTATFDDGVKVQRARLVAAGPTLVYSEETGLGVLRGGVDIHIEAEEEDGDPVDITAEQVEFDVDSDRSTSRGNVSLVSGNQSADAGELVYEEDRNLGQLTTSGGQATITRTDADGTELIITADEIRVLSSEKRLYALGNVTVVDGTITSTGSTVFFDDAQSIAEILGEAGDPARAVDSSNGVTLVSDRIKQDVQYDYFEAIDASQPSEFDTSDFRMAEDGAG